MKAGKALIRTIKLFSVILLASLLMQATAGFSLAAGGNLGAHPQEPAPPLPLQCSNTLSGRYCDIRVVLLIDDTGSMRSNDPAFMRDQGAKNLVNILAQEYYQLAVDAQNVDPTVVVPDIKVAVIHFSHCVSNNPDDHCGNDVKYNSGWLPITEKDALYSAIDWLKTQPNYYRVSQYTHFTQPLLAASELFKDPAADSSNVCVHRLMLLLTDGTPEDVKGPLGEPALGNEMGDVKAILGDYLSQPDSNLYVTAFKILPEYWQATEPYWKTIARIPENVSLESSLDGVASRMEKIVTSIIGAVSNTIPPDANNPRLYTFDVLHHASSLRITYYKLDPGASLTLTDPQGKPVIPDGKTVIQTGKGTAIEVWTLTDPLAGPYQLKTSSTKGIITTIPLYSVSALLGFPSELNPLQQFTEGKIQLQLLDSRGEPVLPADDPADAFTVEAGITQAGENLNILLSPNGDHYQATWMPLTTDPAQLHINVQLMDSNSNSLWTCVGAAGDLPVDPLSVKVTPPSACTPVDTAVDVPIQLINTRTGQNTGIGLPIQWQVDSVTERGGITVDSSVDEVSAQNGEYKLSVKPVSAENIRSHVTGRVLVNGQALQTWSYDQNIPISVCMPQTPPPLPPPPPLPGGNCGAPWGFLLWALLILLLALLLIRLVLGKEKKKFTFPFWVLLILILLLLLMWLLLCFDLFLWPLLILLLILLLIILLIRVISRGDDDRRSKWECWILLLLLIFLLLLWLIFFGGFWFYLFLMLLILLIILVVIWFIARGRNEAEPVPFWLLLILLILLVSIWLVSFGSFPAWLVLILILIWLVSLFWLWSIYHRWDWKTSNSSLLVIFAFVLLVLIWWIYYNLYWIYLFSTVIFLILICLTAWILYRYCNPLWGVIGIVDRKKRLLWSAPLADAERLGGRSYYLWKFKEPVGSVKRLHIHSWDRLKHRLVLSVTLIRGRRTFIRSLEHWKDCALEDGYRIVWLEKVPSPQRKPTKPAPGRGGKTTSKVYSIAEIEGIGSAYAIRLRRSGIHTTDDLLKAAGSRKDRNELAEKTRFSVRQILEWVNRADLMRVPGVGSEFSDLLEAAGVDTVNELRRRSPENLYNALLKVNQRKHLVRRLPKVEEVEAWVRSAAKIRTIVMY